LQRSSLVQETRFLEIVSFRATWKVKDVEAPSKESKKVSFFYLQNKLRQSRRRDNVRRFQGGRDFALMIRDVCRSFFLDSPPKITAKKLCLLCGNVLLPRTRLGDRNTLFWKERLLTQWACKLKILKVALFTLSFIFRRHEWIDRWVMQKALGLVQPNLTKPNLTVPNLTVPNLTVPDLTIPNLTVPNQTLPNVTASNLTAPNLTLPNLTAPT